MNINRHNYEEFFLLYVDKELSAAEKKAVDVFVQENPDLQGELSSLQNAVVHADDISLEKKDWLFMEEKITALQENLLLYADDELNLSDKKAVEVLLASDRSTLAEWHILQQTKLQPDTSIVFTDKQSLYRKETGRVVSIKWWRVAAAAILLGFGLWAGMTVYKNNFKTSTGTGTIANKDQIKPGGATITPAKENTAVQHNTTAVIQKNQSVQPAKDNIQPPEKINKQNTPEQKNNIAVQDNNKKPGNNLPKPYFENINNRGSNENNITSVLPENNNRNTGSGINNVIVKTNPKEKMTNPVIAGLNNGTPDPTTTAAIPVVYTADENTNDRFLYMNEEKVKRSKLGGFIRQAKRVLERTTNIKTGDGLKVAGFEIALK